MKYVALFALTLLSLPTFAASVWHEGEIASIYPLSDGSVVLTFKVAPANCPRSDKYTYITVGQNGVTNEAMNNMLSVALSAAVSKRSVKINYDDAKPNCNINRMIVLF